MKSLLLALALVACAGCLTGREEKTCPCEKNKPVSQRPITADMVTPENASRCAGEMSETLDREDQASATAKTPSGPGKR